jgi:hypothetical protein
MIISLIFKKVAHFFTTPKLAQTPKNSDYNIDPWVVPRNVGLVNYKEFLN